MSAPEFRPGRGAGQADTSLRQCIAVTDHAQQHAVLWFGDIMRRGLYRQLGYSSMRAYALDRLGFSATRAGDFIRLARKLEDLPAVKEQVASGRLGYTKAREIATVADPTNEKDWLQLADRTSRRDLAREVKRARRSAQVEHGPQRGQGSLLPDDNPARPQASAPPQRVAFSLTAEQHARYEALLARIGHRGDAAELLLAMATALAAEREQEQKQVRGGAAAGRHKASAGRSMASAAQPEATPAPAAPPPEIAPRGAIPTPAPHYQIHVRMCPECGTHRVARPAGDLELSPNEAAAAQCDAHIHEPDRPNRSTIPPRVRREVFTRDQHRCRRRGCGHTRHLHLHHLVPRAQGGANTPDNLVTLCAGCHHLWHEHGGNLGAMLRAPEEVE